MLPVTVDGWSDPAYLPPTRTAASLHAAALLAPFDPLVFDRPRVERLFGMRYRIEIYTPAPKRVYGYYVLPFLLGDDLGRARRPQGGPSAIDPPRPGCPSGTGRRPGSGR